MPMRYGGVPYGSESLFGVSWYAGDGEEAQDTDVSPLAPGLPLHSSWYGFVLALDALSYA